jgi:hypothetical protein
MYKVDMARPHGPTGWSKNGYCMGEQLLVKAHPELKFGGKGRMIPGTLLHNYLQTEVFPAGSEFMNFRILGHEQCVMMTINGILRVSQIDTLVQILPGIDTEVWDYKSTASLKYIRDHAKPAHCEQSNLFAFLQGSKTYRIIYISKIDFEGVVSHVYNTNAELAKRSAKRLELVDNILNNRVNLPWNELAEEVETFGDPENECDNCQFNKTETKYCLQHFEELYKTKFRSLGDVKRMLFPPKEVKV